MCVVSRLRATVPIAIKGFDIVESQISPVPIGLKCCCQHNAYTAAPVCVTPANKILRSCAYVCVRRACVCDIVRSCLNRITEFDEI